MLITAAHLQPAAKVKDHGRYSSLTPIGEDPSPPGDFFEHHRVVGAALATGMAVAQGLEAFPKFIYPTVVDATPAERTQIYNVLNSLPLADVSDAKTISMVPSIASNRPGWVTLGISNNQIYSTSIDLSRKELTSPDALRATLTHEVGHTVDFRSGLYGVLGNDSSNGIFGKPPYATDYAKTSTREDFAVSYETYHDHPGKLQQVAPQKYASVAKVEHQGFLQSMIDRPEFRGTGRWVGEHLGNTTTMRDAVEGFSFASGFMLSARGLNQLRIAASTNDPASHFQGVLNLTAGTLFATGMLGIPGLAVKAANLALIRGVKRDEINAVDADAAVRTMTDPVSRATHFLSSSGKSSDPFRSLKDRYPTYQPKRVRAAGIATGGAVGGVVGGLAGPYAGVIAGYHLAAGAGGAAGLVVGELVGYLAGTELGGRAGGAIARALGG